MKIIDIYGSENNEELLKKTARLYCEIWKEPPWNEYFWQEEKVLTEIQDQLSKEKAIITLALDKKEVVGFTWGYCVNKESMKAISSHDLLSFLFEPAPKSIFYIDEIGVDKRYRLQGVGMKITKRIIKQTENGGISCWCLRTHIDAIPAKKMYGKLGFSDLMIKDGKHQDRTYWMLG